MHRYMYVWQRIYTYALLASSPVLMLSLLTAFRQLRKMLGLREAALPASCVLHVLC